MSDAKFTGPMRDTYLLKAAKEKQSERNTESLTPRRNPGIPVCLHTGSLPEQSPTCREVC